MLGHHFGVNSYCYNNADPPRVDPLSAIYYDVKRSEAKRVKKVALNLLKIGQLVAYR